MKNLEINTKTKFRGDSTVGKLIKANDLVYDAIKLLRHVYRSDETDVIKSLKTTAHAISDSLSELNKTEDYILDKFASCVGKFYKMTVYQGDDDEYKTRKFVYVTRVLNDNSTIWFLENDFTNEYEGGLKYVTYEAENFLNKKILLEEITEEKFRKEALASVELSIDFRKNKVEEMQIEERQD